jgi:hypothetical protein
LATNKKRRREYSLRPVFIVAVNSCCTHIILFPDDSVSGTEEYYYIDSVFASTGRACSF